MPGTLFRGTFLLSLSPIASQPRLRLHDHTSWLSPRWVGFLFPIKLDVKRNVTANTRPRIASLGENVVGLSSPQKVVEPDVSPALVESSSIEKTGHSQQGETIKELEQESQTVPSQYAIDHEAYPEPTEEERSTLRKVYDTIPLTAWTLCFVEVGERASYYGAKAAFNNFMQFPLPEGGPGTGAINPDNPNDHAGAL